MDEPNVPEALALAPELRVSIGSPDVTYFLGRETVIVTKTPGMAVWREKLFVLMARNAIRATAFFKLPPDSVVELGVQSISEIRSYVPGWRCPAVGQIVVAPPNRRTRSRRWHSPHDRRESIRSATTTAAPTRGRRSAVGLAANRSPRPTRDPDRFHARSPSAARRSEHLAYIGKRICGLLMQGSRGAPEPDRLGLEPASSRPASARRSVDTTPPAARSWRRRSAARAYLAVGRRDPNRRETAADHAFCRFS